MRGIADQADDDEDDERHQQHGDRRLAEAAQQELSIHGTASHAAWHHAPCGGP
jgi:hypothetical protein